MANTLHINNNSAGASISNVIGATGLTGIAFPLTYGQSDSGTFDNGFFSLFVEFDAPPTKLSLLQFIDNGYLNKNSVVRAGSSASVVASNGTISNTNGNQYLTLTDNFYAIIQEPAGQDDYAAFLSTTLCSANNFSMYTTLSSHYNETDYLYIGDVYVNGEKVVTLKSYPDPATAFGVFDLSSVANKYVSYDFSSNFYVDAAIINSAPNSSCSLQVKFREQYTSGSTFVSPLGTTDASIVYYLNSSLPYVDSVSQNPPLSKYLTTWPFSSSANYSSYRSMNLSKVGRSWLYFFNESINPVTYIQYITYDSAGEMIGQYRVQNIYSANNQVCYVTTGYLPLSSSAIYEVVSGPDDLINGDVASYDVVLSNSSTLYTGGNAFDAFHFNLVDECTKFSDTYSVYWLNTMGGFDSFRFALKNVTTQNKTQTPYKKVQGTLGADGFYRFNTYDPSLINFFTKVNTEIQLNSGFLSDNEVDLLKGLFSSPVIFIEDKDQVVQSVTISDTDYLVHRRVNGQKAYSLQLTANISNSSYRQLL